MREDLGEYLPKRKKDSHKGDYGRVLVIAGSKGMAGASFLCAKGSYLAGAGLVTVFAPEDNRGILQTLLPEAMVISYDLSTDAWNVTAKSLIKACKSASVLCIGPGLSQSNISVRILRTVLEYADEIVRNNVRKDISMVLDADALNILSEYPDLIKLLKDKKVILTPHMGEMSRLCRVPVSVIMEDPEKHAGEFADTAGVTLVLKSAETLIAKPQDEKVIINRHAGNNGMSTGGSGDVLSGLIAGFLAQSGDVLKSACAGVLTHALAGDKAANNKGVRSMLAGDILEAVSDVLKEYE